MNIPRGWESALSRETEAPYFHELRAFLSEERARHRVFPEEADVFRAFELTPLSEVKVVLLGQDPYHDEGQAHGLCFSVLPPVPAPPSLRNIFRELNDDLAIAPPSHGDLSAWARQGVLMLNTVLTVAAHEPASHKNKGWERFTDAVIASVNDAREPVVFCLWGNHARARGRLVDRTRHVVIEGAHPSPLSAKKFFGSRPFSAVNAALAAKGRPPIDWRLPKAP
jgi:uracil-DNA glycosylase